MSFQELAIAIGLLTPLILGILAFIEKFINRKKDDDDDNEPQVVQGMTVPMENPYADQLIDELRRDISERDRTIDILKARIQGKEEA